jgi:hypothetical protein
MEKHEQRKTDMMNGENGDEGEAEKERRMAKERRRRRKKKSSCNMKRAMAVLRKQSAIEELIDEQ